MELLGSQARDLMHPDDIARVEQSVGDQRGHRAAEAGTVRTIEDLLRNADAALYRAKRAGGGRIESVLTTAG